MGGPGPPDAALPPKKNTTAVTEVERPCTQPGNWGARCTRPGVCACKRAMYEGATAGLQLSTQTKLPSRAGPYTEKEVLRTESKMGRTDTRGAKN